MFCSTVIPTVSRATLARAVQSVLAQERDEDDFEVIVVNDSGRPLPRSDWLDSPRVRILATNRKERSVARNTGAAVAEGRYLHFLDDDDWLEPGALRAFRRLAEARPSAWLYGGYRFVDPEGRTLEENRPDEEGNCFVRFMTGEWLPLQASLVDARAFAAVGGFAPLSSLLGGNEDVHLSREITLSGDLAGTPEIVATIRVCPEESTTNYADLHRQSRLSRERLLAVRGAFARVRSSARSRPADVAYWKGRVLRMYLASATWNLKRLRALTAVRSGCLGLAALATSGGDLLSPGFVRGALGLDGRPGRFLHFQIESVRPAPSTAGAASEA